MKKTVIFKKIDGHEIITGFSRPTIDPVETNKIACGDADNPGLIQATDEWQALEAKKAEYGEAVKAMHTAARAKDDTAYKAALSAMSVRQDELKPLARDLSDKITALRLEHAVHFTPRAGEFIRDASDVDSLSQAMQDRAQGTEIDLDGSTVEDNRGKVFFRKSEGKWGRTQIVRLGDPVPNDATLVADVTPEQAIEIERDLIAALPADVKLKEKQKAEGRVLADSMEMRSGLEIQGDKDALKKSKKWYDETIAHIKGLYK